MTAAETCELVMALDAIGETERAHQLFRWVQFLRHDDGSYWCGMNFDGDVFDRPGEHFTADQPTWNSAAVVLAAHALGGSGPTAGLFRGEDLPVGLACRGAPPGRRRDRARPQPPLAPPNRRPYRTPGVLPRGGSAVDGPQRRRVRSDPVVAIGV